ncbi:hypothetical protein EVAR_62483_1 [Eumeta japonica]|uniref:Uncharacterized protein n=1 Tax=Eumeta variegata TaxID=151549 RepID=A0A4C1ZHJ4_EUMVA|nr:hypothetical protein EVAR_62483_1 [Eumeta japonica]
MKKRQVSAALECLPIWRDVVTVTVSRPTKRIITAHWHYGNEPGAEAASDRLKTQCQSHETVLCFEMRRAIIQLMARWTWAKKLREWRTQTARSPKATSERGDRRTLQRLSAITTSLGHGRRQRPGRGVRAADQPARRD